MTSLNIQMIRGERGKNHPPVICNDLTRAARLRSPTNHSAKVLAECGDTPVSARRAPGVEHRPRWEAAMCEGRVAQE